MYMFSSYETFLESIVFVLLFYVLTLQGGNKDMNISNI